MALSFSIKSKFYWKTKLCITVPGRQGKYVFPQDSFYQHGILNNITEQDTSFLDCKHTHMMKNRASTDKFGVLYRLLATEFHGFNSRIDFSGLSLFGPWYYLFREVMGPFKIKNKLCNYLV